MEFSKSRFQVVESLVPQGFAAAGDRLSPKLSTETRDLLKSAGKSSTCRQVVKPWPMRTSLWTACAALGTSLVGREERSLVEVMHKTGAPAQAGKMPLPDLLEMWLSPCPHSIFEQP